MSASSPKKRILFFSPLAARNGAEMMLLHLMKHIDPNRYEMAVFFNQDGPLVNDFRENGIRVFVSPFKQKRFYYHYERLRNKYLKSSAYESMVMKIQKEFKADLWYMNTLKLSHLVPMARKASVPIVVHSHENKYQLSEFGQAALQNILQADGLIGCAEWVTKSYSEMGMKRLRTLYEMVDLSAIQVRPEKVKELRQKYGIGDDEFVWLMSGNTAYRKGIDFIPEIIEHLGDRAYKILWVGPFPGDALWSYTQSLLKQRNDRHFIHCGPQKELYYEHFALANGFMLTSRYDSFPLVMTEAAHFGLPIAALDSGGVKEFVSPGCGEVVKGHDTKALAEAMIRIMDGKSDVSAEKLKARAAEFDAARLSRQWQEMIDEFFQERGK